MLFYLLFEQIDVYLMSMNSIIQILILTKVISIGQRQQHESTHEYSTNAHAAKQNFGENQFMANETFAFIVKRNKKKKKKRHKTVCVCLCR